MRTRPAACTCPRRLDASCRSPQVCAALPWCAGRCVAGGRPANVHGAGGAAAAGPTAMPLACLRPSGDSHTCVLTELGAVWAWGTYRDASGVMGFDPHTRIQVRTPLPAVPTATASSAAPTRLPSACPGPPAAHARAVHAAPPAACARSSRPCVCTSPRRPRTRSCVSPRVRCAPWAAGLSGKWAAWHTLPAVLFLQGWCGNGRRWLAGSGL